MSSNSTNGSLAVQYTSFNPRIFVIAAIILIVIIFVYILLHLWSRYFYTGSISISIDDFIQNPANRSNHSFDTLGLSPSVISALPVISYRNFDAEGGFVECTICLVQLEEEKMVKMLPRCKHMFHVDCIDMWLYSHSSCPVCRADAEPPDESVGSSEMDNNMKDVVGNTSHLGNSLVVDLERQ